VIILKKKLATNKELTIEPTTINRDLSQVQSPYSYSCQKR